MRVIILTRSDKHRFNKDGTEKAEGGFCVAGVLEDDPAKWVRLIGSHEYGKITYDEARYADGTLCEPLDIIDVDACLIDTSVRDSLTAQRLPGFENYPIELLDVQPENYLVSGRFQLVRQISIDDFLALTPTSTCPYIFSNTSSSLSVSEAITNHCSLVMVKVDHLELYPQDEFKAHYKARFRYQGQEYDDITVTDPDYAAGLSDFARLVFGDTYLVISVGEKFRDRHYRDRHYKLIAKIFRVVYTIPNNRFGFFHSYRDCRYLKAYTDVTRALWQELIDQGLKECNVCKERLGSE